MSESHKSFRLVTAWLAIVRMILLSTPIICELGHFHVMSTPTVLTTSLTGYSAEHVVPLQSPPHLRHFNIWFPSFNDEVFRSPSRLHPNAHCRAAGVMLWVSTLIQIDYSKENLRTRWLCDYSAQLNTEFLSTVLLLVSYEETMPG